MRRRGQFVIVAVCFIAIHLSVCAQPEQIQHIHNTGSTLHPVMISVTSDSVLISSETQFKNSQGYPYTCILPASIPFANIVKAVAQPYHGFLGVDGHVAELHLEVRDSRGRKSTYNFVSSTAINDDHNVWHEGEDHGNQVRTL